MSMWADAYDEMSRMDRQADGMSTDQRLKLAQVKALLAIGQELSVIQRQGVNPQFEASRD